MRNMPGAMVPVNGRSVYVERSGTGPDWVVFEAAGGCGRTCWDPVLPHLATAQLVTYDRAGRALTDNATQASSVQDMAADLVATVQAVVPGEFVLVAHSMGGLVARCAVERLATRLRGLLLIDPSPETSPAYDTWDHTTKRIDRTLALTQPLTRFRPLAALFSGNVRRLFTADTYQAMLAEDFTPAGIAQTRIEMQAVAAAIPQCRSQPPPLPTCPTVVLSAARPAKGRERQNAGIREHQRRYAASLPDAGYEEVDSGHFIQAEQPHLVAGKIRQLLDAHPITPRCDTRAVR